MSLRWSEQLNISLAPTAVGGALWGRGWSSQPARHVVLQCPSDAAAPAWRPALEALGGWVRELRVRHVPVRVLLSNHFVRYLVVPWTSGLSRRDERLGMARHLFRQTFGDAATGWNIQLAGAGYGQAALACAVEDELLVALRAAFAQSKLECRSAQPLFALAFNRFRAQIGDDACLIVLEPGRLCCAVVRKGQWQSVLSARRTPDMSTARLIDRQLRLMALDTRVPVFVFDPMGEDAAQDTKGRWRWLAPRTRQRGDPAMALLGAP